MAVEKAFAIKASAQNIYAALERDLMGASDHAGETFEVLRSERDRSMDLRVTIGGASCWLTYRLEPGAEHTEVVARLQPYGWRYALFRIVTLGMRDQNYAMMLVQGLANLKAAVEGEEESESGQESGIRSQESGSGGSDSS